jgi:hypothetical protein
MKKRIFKVFAWLFFVPFMCFCALCFIPVYVVTGKISMFWISAWADYCIGETDSIEFGRDFFKNEA